MTRALFAFATMLFFIASASSFAAECSETQLENDASSVEDPCTAIIEAADATPAQKFTAYYIRGRGYHRTRRLNQAGSDYIAAVNIDPDRSAIFVDMGNLAARGNRLDQATAYAKRALELDPKNPRAHAFMAAIFNDEEKWTDAITEANLALAIDAAEPFGLIGRLIARRAQKDYAAALADADALIAIDATKLSRYGFVDEAGRPADFHAATFQYRALVYEAQGDLAKAEADYNASVAAKAEPNTLAWRAAFFLKQPGREQDALRDFRSSASLDPTDAFSPFSIGRILAALHHYPDAVKSLDRALSLYPYYADAYMLRSQIKGETGELEGAYQDEMAALTLNPTLIWPTLDKLKSLGYYQSADLPQTMTPALADAVKACWIDPDCHQGSQ
jgi:tetratricopeptide (TPR) repeat protein